MRVSNAAPSSKRSKGPRIIAAAPPKPKRVVNRAVWQPNNAKTVILACGHVSMAWPLIQRLRPLLDCEEGAGAVYCEKCEAWIPIFRVATAAEIVGIDTSQLYSGEEPPY